MNKAVVSFSGGLDSTVLLYHAKSEHDQVLALSFNYSQRHIKELDYAKKTADKLGIEHKIVDISFFSQLAHTSSLTNPDIKVDNVKDIIGEAQPSQYVPCRNMMLLSIACAAAESYGAQTVYHGAALVDSLAGYWDGSEFFIHSMNSVIALNRKNRITIKTPLIEMSKSEIIRKGLTYNIDFKNTLTCYNGTDSPCGTCPSCSLRIQGFLEAGIKDPLVYQIQDKLEAVYNLRSITG